MADMDTAAKRLSVLDWDQPWNPGIPIPDGADSNGDRFHGLWTYSGIAAAAAVADHIIVVLQGETLSVPRIRTETLSVDRILSETLSVPRITPEVLSC